MRWVIKIAESAGQKRITLPKAFCATHDIKQGEYLVIDDRDSDNIMIGRLIYGGNKKRDSKDD